jgi:hypothetical protein
MLHHHGRGDRICIAALERHRAPALLKEDNDASVASSVFAFAVAHCTEQKRGLFADQLIVLCCVCSRRLTTCTVSGGGRPSDH